MLAALLAVGLGVQTVLAPARTLAQTQAAEVAPDPDRERIERIVREYLLANPEIMVEVMQRLEAKQLASRSKSFEQGLESVRDQLFSDPTAPFVGNPNGTVVIVEFSDYNCPYCRQMMPVVEQAITRNNDLKVIMREFPILGPSSQYAAAAALAANRQDKSKYPQVHRRLFEIKGQLTETRVNDVLADLGYDMDRLKTDMKHPDVEAAIERTLQIAQVLGINGTPAFIGGGRLAPGAISLEQFEELVSQAASAK